MCPKDLRAVALGKIRTTKAIIKTAATTTKSSLHHPNLEKKLK